MNNAIEQLNEVNFKNLEDMLLEIEALSNEESITLPADSLKQLCRSYIAAIAYITGNLEHVKQYLENNKLL